MNTDSSAVKICVHLRPSVVKNPPTSPAVFALATLGNTKTVKTGAIGQAANESGDVQLDYRE
jgi:hypothetical protein